MSNMRRSSAAALRTSASVFAALGDETRLGLLAKLTTGEPQSISRLTSGTRLTRQAVTKHLRVLQGAGVVAAARRGRETCSASDPKPTVAGLTYFDHSAVPRYNAWDVLRH